MGLDAPSMERAAAPYRESAKRSTAAASAPLVVDLEAAPPGRSAAKLDAEVFRDALASSDEWDRVWVAVWLAYRQASLRKPLDARVSLETALETVETPAYRALPPGQLDAHRHRAQHRRQRTRWTHAHRRGRGGDCARKGLLAGVIVTMHVLRITQAVITNAVRRLRMRSAAIAGAIAAAFFVFAWVWLGYPLERTAVAGMVGIAWSAGFAWWSLSWSLAGTSKAARARPKLLEWAGAAACVALPMFWLVRTRPPPAPPASSASHASEEQFPPRARVDQPPPGVIVIPPDPPEELGR